MSKSPKEPLRLDPAKLMTMKEPFIVRVEKMRGSSRMPIELPVRGDGLAPGEGWDKDSILKIDNWLATTWSGGGVYRILVVDQQGDRLEWESVYDPRQFPERIPETMTPVGSAPAAAPAPQAATATFNGSWPPQVIGWSTPPQVSGNAGPQQSTAGPWAQPGAGAPGMPPPGYNGSSGNGFNGNGNGNYNNGNGGGGWAAPGWTPPSSRRRYSPRPWSDDTVSNPWFSPPPPVTPYRERERDDRGEEERRKLQEQLQKMQEERLAANYQAQLDRLQQEHRMQLQALQEEIRRNAERLATTSATSPEAEQLREQRAQLERERLIAQQEEKERREELRREHERLQLEDRFRQMQEMIVKTNEAAQNQLREIVNVISTKSTGPDPAVSQLQDQLRAQQEEMRRAQERLENENRMREMREQMRMQEEANRRQLEALQMQLQQNRGPDPALTLMQTLMDRQTAAMQEAMRNQQQTFDRMNNQSMTARDVIALVKDSSSGIDDLRKTLTNTYSDIFNTQKMVVEHAMQLSGGGGPSLGERVIEGAVERVGALADKYLTVQRDRTVSAAKAQQAQADAAAAQAAAYAAAVQRNAPAGAAQATPPASPAAQAAAQAAAQVKKQQRQAPTTAPAESASGGLGDAGAATGAPGATTPPMGKVIQMRRHGRTDEEWFGLALPEVKKLRTGVAKFLQSIGRMDAQGNHDPDLDENGNPIGYGPEQCAQFLLIGANRISGLNVAVPAFDNLFKEGRFADFLDVVLPDAPQPFRDDVVKCVLAEMEAAGEGPEVADVDDETDEADDDEAEDEAAE